MRFFDLHFRRGVLVEALVLAVNQHIQGAFGSGRANAVGVNAELGAGHFVYAGDLRMGGEQYGIELRYQFFTLGESESQNNVGSRIDALIRNQADAVVHADIDDA